ncbi:MAG: winged helix-turn-helix transcriptional regulator [Solirubrobacterales bacterium]|nr:winged helix-turn-helix transcriptional regulator [Solirubrobacterales bacterium]
MPTDDPTAYGGSLAFLLSQIGARSAALFTERLEPLGITPREFAVLSHVAASEAKTQQQLADLLGIHRNNMVALIDEMEASGWVRRYRGETDRRAFEIRASTRGARMVADINALLPELDHTLTGGLGERDRKTLTRLLRRTADDLGLPTAVHPWVAGRQR